MKDTFTYALTKYFLMLLIDDVCVIQLQLNTYGYLAWERGNEVRWISEGLFATLISQKHIDLLLIQSSVVNYRRQLHCSALISPPTLHKLGDRRV